METPSSQAEGLEGSQHQDAEGNHIARVAYSALQVGVGGCDDDVRMMIWTSKEAFRTVSHYLGGFDKLQGLTPPSDSEILFVEYYKWIQVSGCTLLK